MQRKPARSQGAVSGCDLPTTFLFLWSSVRAGRRTELNPGAPVVVRSDSDGGEACGAGDEPPAVPLPVGTAAAAA